MRLADGRQLLLPRPLAVVGAAALASPGLFRLHDADRRLLDPRAAAPASRPRFEVSDDDLAAADGARPPGSAKANKQMSRAARLATATMAQALVDADWPAPRTAVGAFLGVGSSGAALEELTALLAGSVVDGEFSLAAFGGQGLGAANPLLAFQLMNNFSLCHGAIESGLGGESSAYFSRGAGTAAALAAAAWSLLDPAPSVDPSSGRVLVGGADSARHPVTAAELRRTGALTAGLQPSEGAALLALATEPAADAVFACELLACAVVPLCDDAPPSAAGLLYRGADAALSQSLATLFSPSLFSGVEAVVVAAALDSTRQLLLAELATHAPALLSHCLDLAPLGETLAAGPALGWYVALEALRSDGAARVAVLSLGIDGALGLALFGRRR